MLSWGVPWAQLPVWYLMQSFRSGVMAGAGACGIQAYSCLSCWIMLELSQESSPCFIILSMIPWKLCTLHHRQMVVSCMRSCRCIALALWCHQPWCDGTGYWCSQQRTQAWTGRRMWVYKLVLSRSWNGASARIYNEVLGGTCATKFTRGVMVLTSCRCTICRCVIVEP